MIDQKRVCVVKVGLKMVTNISQENYVVLKVLSELGYVIDCYTDNSKFGTYDIKNVNFYDFKEYYNKSADYYEALFIINGVISYYGGFMQEHCAETIKIINAYKGNKVYYLWFDELLPLQQYWPGIEKKQDKYNWPNRYTKEQIEIVRDDITVITLIEDLEFAKKIQYRQNIKFKDLLYFPLSKLHIIIKEDDIIPFNSNNKKVDLIYGGTFRRGGRESKMINYYFNHKEDINVKMFGKVKLEKFNKNKIKDLRPPIFSKSVAADKFMKKLSESYSTIVIIDQKCEGKRLTPRVYQSIFSNILTFIDEAYDPDHLIYTHPDLQQMYITSKEQIYPILDRVKKDKDYFEYICKLQIDSIKIKDRDAFLNSFNDLIK